MLTPRRTHRLPTFLLGCLTAALLTTQAVAAIPVIIDYTDGQTDANPIDTSAPNDPTGLSILSGTATQSGIITGTGQVIKLGAGTLILSGANNYTGGTTLNAGSLEVAAGGTISHASSNLTIGDQNGDVATLNLTGGRVTSGVVYLGNESGSSGTANVSGGDWTSNSVISVGNLGTGVLNITGGSVSSLHGVLGSGSNGYIGSGTVNVSGGSWINSGLLMVGVDGTGVLNISGGTVSDQSGILASYAGNDTANVSGGTWNNEVDLVVGGVGSGVLNLTGGTVSVGSGSGTLTLAASITNLLSSGTLNLGTGGAAGTLEAGSVLGGDGTAVVNFNHTGSLNFTPTLDGNLSVNQIGPGTTTLTAENTYTGDTSVLGGTLELKFGSVTSDILTSNNVLNMGSGTLLLTGTGTQHVFLLNTTGGAGSIVLGQDQVLGIAVLFTVADYSALNFNLAAGGADGDVPGSGSVFIQYHSFIGAINPTFTVTDATGFGLATVDGDNQVLRLTSTALLPASGADSSTDYLIDNNPGDSTTAGSSSLIVTDLLPSARSITVDTTAAPGVLTLAENTLLTTSVLNFGSAAGSSHAFEITGGPNSGITTDAKGGFVQINNYNAAPVTISTSILETVATGLRVGGTGTTILTATSNYTGDTIVTSGVLEVATNGSINNSPSSTIVGSQQGDHATLLISGGSLTDGSVYLGQSYGSSGTVTVTSGDWTNNGEFKVGDSGTGVLNLTGGGMSNSTDFLGYASGSSGTANVSGGTWTNYLGFFVGDSGTGVLNLSGGYITNLNFDSILGNNAGSSGTANVSGGTWNNNYNKLIIGNEGTGVLNLSGGSMNSSGVLGNLAGSSGTANVSGGLWMSNDFTIGSYGTGVVNLNGGGVSSGNGPLYMATHAGSSGTLNIGTGGVMGTVSASSIIGGDGTAVVNFNHTDETNFGTKLEGSLTVNFIGPGTTNVWGQSTYTGPTNLLGGTLSLGYFIFGSNHVLSTTTDLTLGSATLSILSGDSNNTVHTLSTRADSAGSIILKAENQTLDLGALASVGTHSALNFDTAAGGADGATAGSSTVLLDGQTAGSAINPGFTVTDSTGFGLATVNGLGQIIRLTTTDLLPATATDSGTDYLINSNAGDSSTPGSALLTVTENQTARSITVDTTAANGVLTLGSGVVISSDVWNFGGTRKSTFEITGGDSGGGITSATAGGTLQINNYKALPVLISAAIKSNGNTSVLFQGTGTTVLAGKNSYRGDTTITSGLVEVAKTGSIDGPGTTTVGKQTGDNAYLVILGKVLNLYGIIGDATAAIGTVNVSQTGQWLQKGDLTVGKSGTGVLNIDQGTVVSGSSFIGANTGSSGTVTVSNAGGWNVSGGLFIGQNGTGVLNISSRGGVSVNGGGVTLGAQGTLNIGTGGTAGSLNAPTVTGVSGAVVNYNYNGLTKFTPPPSTVLRGDLAVNKLGGGYLRFDKQNTYTGGTTVNGGVLSLNFGTVISDMISSQSALTLGGGSLNLFNNSASSASQTLNGLTTTAGTGSQIYLSSNNTLDLGALTSAGKGSALNFYLYDVDADGATVGTGIVLLSGQTAGSVINPGFTVTDRGGFGLATVNDLNQIIRLTSTDLLPDSGAVAGADYRIDNNDGDPIDPGSSSLEITASQTVRSITVDSSASSGLLTLGSGSVLSNDVWNFGGRNAYEITGSDSGAGIKTATVGGMLQINNYNGNTLVTLSAPILDNGGSGLRVAGPDGITILNGSDTYKGETIINNGTLLINGDHTAATGEVIVQSSAELAGIGQIGSNIHVLNGGMLTPGTFDDFGDLTGTLTGTTATFDTNSIFHVVGSGSTIGTLHLTGGVTIASGALIYIETDSDLTLSKYTLMTADGGGLDGDTPFTLGSFFGKLPSNGDVIPGYHLVYTGNTLDLVSDVTAPAVAYWTGKVNGNWSSLTSGTTNWATAADGLTDTGALPDSPTDVTFSATGVGQVDTNLDINFTVNSLTVNSDTNIFTGSAQTLTVNATTTVNDILNLDSGVTVNGNGAFTIGTAGTLSGSGAVVMAADQSIFVNGAISVRNSEYYKPFAQELSLTTSGTGAIVMGAGSILHMDLYSGAGLGDNSATPAAADILDLHGTLDATAGGTLLLGNPNHMSTFVGGDRWKVVELNSAAPNAGSVTGHLVLNDSSLGLTTGFTGSFDQTTGIYTIADHRPEMTTQTSGLPMANAEGQSIISGVQTSTNDVNNHLFNLRSGGGEEDGPDGSIASSIDDGVVVGQGDGPEDPIAKRIKRTRQWEVFTTVNYGNVRLNPISNQSGVQIDSWASSVGIERHLSRGLTLGFAATFLQSTQTYTGGLGKLDLEGPTLSAYLSYVKKAFWSSLLYSFGDYDLGSSRNPGLGLPTASGATNAYTNAIQYNTGWNFRFLNNTLVTGPFAGIDYLHGTVDSYSETGGGLGALSYGKQTFQSLVTRIGWSTSKKIETDWATITPQIRLSYERQNVRNNGTSVSLINAPFSATGGNQSPGQDYMVIGTGVNFQFSPEFNMNLGYQTQIFRNNMTSHFGSVRFGYKF